MKTIKIILLSFLLCSLNILFGQEENQKRNVMLSVVPQYMIKNGIRFDLEKLYNEDYSFTIAPQFYSGFIKNYHPYNFSEFEKTYESNNPKNISLGGTGLELIAKAYIENHYSWKPYIGLGLNYTYFNIRYEKDNWTSYIENDIEYYKIILSEGHQKINKTGINFMGGFLVFFDKRIFWDFYTGIGIKRSFIKDSLPFPADFSEGFLNYGYSGPIFLGGMKMGIKI